MKDRETDGMMDDELDRVLASLPYPDPGPHFADRVMARVTLPAPVPAYRAAPVAVRRPAALAAALAAAVVGSLAASIIWTVGHQASVASLGGWLLALAGQGALAGLLAFVQVVVVQPGSAILRALATSPATLVAASAVGSLLYLSGLLTLRRLLSVPNRQVMHVQR